METKKLHTVTLEMQDFWAHTKPMVHKSDKLYTRKKKHKKLDM